MGSAEPAVVGNDDYAAALSQLHRLLLDYRGTAGFLTQLAVLAARSVGPKLSCGIMLQFSGPPLIVATSDPFATLAQQVQYRLGQGPCLDCLRVGERVRADDLAAEGRWPVFALRATGIGLRSCLCLPFGMQGMAAALSFFSPSPQAFGTAEVSRAETFAEYGGSALLVGGRQDHATAGELREVLAGRAMVDQALGLIMASERCTSSRAWAILRTASINRRLEVHELAREIVSQQG